MKDLPNDQSEDIRALMIATRRLRDQMKRFEEEVRWRHEQQIGTLEGMTRYCDCLLYLLSELYYGQHKKENDAPVDP